MTLEQIRDQLETATGLPAHALGAAVGQAAALAPAVIEAIGKAVAGLYLLPRQKNLLFFGLHALAAAGEASVYPALLALLRLPEHRLEQLLGDGLTESVPGLLLGLYDGNVDSLYAILEDPGTDGMVKWSVFQVLARLVWEGRASLDRMIDLLDRFDSDAMAPPGDYAWHGWEDTVLFLGLTDFEGRVRQAWQDGRLSGTAPQDQRDWLERLHRPSSGPDRSDRFDGHVQRFSNPVVALAWWTRLRPVLTSPIRGRDPADGIRLSHDELDWLGGFLISDRAPETTLDLEQLDGFFTALNAGPEQVPIWQCIPRVWGTDDGTSPRYDDPEQAAFVVELLTRHWNTIARRLEDRVPHPPILLPDMVERQGRGWAEGFLLAVSLHEDAWRPLLEAETPGSPLGLIGQLADDDALPARMRSAVLSRLPEITAAIRAGWHRRDASPFAPQPARSAKIGRNDPCPCGSGRKYKKCCGVPGKSDVAIRV